MSEVEVKQISAQLTAAVSLMLDGQTPQVDRMAAYQKIEVFKQESPQMALKCGLFLTAASCPQVKVEVKHFGLKIIEDIIKLRWNEMSLEEKVMIKEAGMRMMASLERHPAFIKDGISRILVEIIKR